MPVDYRYNPFTNTKQPMTITGERLTVPLVSPFVIRLAEVPLKEVPSTLTMRVVDILATAITTTGQTTATVANPTWFTIGRTITIDSEKMLISNIVGAVLTVVRAQQSTVAATHVISSDVFIESSVSEVAATPNTGQYWPDYSTNADGDTGWNTGTILFNSTDAGKKIAVNYKGMGSLADSRIIPTGAIMLWSGSSAAIPATWQLCDGTKGTPNLVNRFVVGAGGTYAVNTTGGEATHILTTAEMPSHTHTGTTRGAMGAISSGATDYPASASTVTGATGGGSAHNNLPPYFALCYIIKL